MNNPPSKNRSTARKPRLSSTSASSTSASAPDRKSASSTSASAPASMRASVRASVPDSKGAPKKNDAPPHIPPHAPVAPPNAPPNAPVAPHAHDTRKRNAALEAEIHALKDQTHDTLKRNAELEAEIHDLKDQILRVRAESENQRKRHRRELEEKLKYAYDPLMRALLPIADNLGRALLSIGKIDEQSPPEIKSLAEGIAGIEKDLLNIFQNFGVQRIEAEGKKFDPMRHEAMGRVEDDKHAPGIVVHELRAGFSIHERLLRPSGVMVAFAKEDKPSKE